MILIQKLLVSLIVRAVILQATYTVRGRERKLELVQGSYDLVDELRGVLAESV